MPAHAQSQSQVEEILSLVQRRIWQVLLPAVLTSSVGVMLAALLPRKYSALTRLELVDQTEPLKQAGVESQGFASEAFAAQYQIRSFERVRRVLEALQWEEFETLPPDGQYRYVDRVVGDLRVRPIEVPKTKAIFLEITYQDSDPNHAAQFLNELREVYVAEKLAALRTQAEQLRDQMQGELEDDQLAYQEALDTYEEQLRMHGLSPTQQAPGGNRSRSRDPAEVNLEEAQRELRNAETQLAADLGTLQQAQVKLDAEPLSVRAPELAGGVDPAVRVAQIDQAIEAERSKQVGLKPPNRQYKIAQREIDRLQAQKEKLLLAQKEPAADVPSIPNPRRAALEAQISALEIELAGHRTRVDLLQAEVERLQASLALRTEAYARLSELDFELDLAKQALELSTAQYEKQRRLAEVLLSSEFTPFEVTEYAFPAGSPSSPNVPFVIGAATAVGLALGLVIALLLEFGRGAFRGPVDLGAALPVPVLGVINEIVTAAERRTRSLRRSLVGTTTVALSLSILWTTWAYQSHPRLLGSEVVGFLDDVRERLR